MKLATIDDCSRDGALFVVSRDLRRMVSAAGVALTMQTALERWIYVESALRRLSDLLNSGTADALPFDLDAALAPLPRGWQRLDGSASCGRPLVRQGPSDCFLPWNEDVRLPDEADEIDHGGAFGVIVDAVPLGTSIREAGAHIRLIMQVNDWSFRTAPPDEADAGFGWGQVQPPPSVAPIAVTPDELGDAWHEGRVALTLRVDRNGERFVGVGGAPMNAGFPELVAHAARARSLVAGTVIVSRTVSSGNAPAEGSSWKSERRGAEPLDGDVARTPFMRCGDRVRMEAKAEDGTPVFGAIDQQVVPA